MTQTIYYGGPESLYEDLLRFITKSERVINSEGDSYSVYHTQYASFNTTELFSVLVEQTTAHPVSEVSEFSSEVRENANEAAAVIDDYTVQNFYEKREYVTSQDISSAATTYLSRSANNRFDGQSLHTVSETLDRKQCIADILTLLFSERAVNRAHWKFNVFGGMRMETNDGEDHHPNEGIDDSEAVFALRDVVETFNERAVLKQPNPTRHTIRVLYNVFNDIGMNPSVREIYGILVDPYKQTMYKHTDADGRETQTAIANLGNIAMGAGETEKRWVNPDEPPLKTIKNTE